MVNGIINSIENQNSINQTFNITYGDSSSINELLEILKKEFKNINVSYEKRDKLMPIRGTLSTSKAKKLLGYESQWPIETGYIKYINWYKSFFKKI